MGLIEREVRGSTPRYPIGWNTDPATTSSPCGIRRLGVEHWAGCGLTRVCLQARWPPDRARTHAARLNQLREYESSGHSRRPRPSGPVGRELQRLPTNHLNVMVFNQRHSSHHRWISRLDRACCSGGAALGDPFGAQCPHNAGSAAGVYSRHPFSGGILRHAFPRRSHAPDPARARARPTARSPIPIAIQVRCHRYRPLPRGGFSSCRAGSLIAG